MNTYFLFKYALLAESTLLRSNSVILTVKICTFILQVKKYAGKLQYET